MQDAALLCTPVCKQKEILPGAQMAAGIVSKIDRSIIGRENASWIGLIAVACRWRMDGQFIRSVTGQSLSGPDQLARPGRVGGKWLKALDVQPLCRSLFSCKRTVLLYAEP